MLVSGAVASWAESSCRLRYHDAGVGTGDAGVESRIDLDAAEGMAGASVSLWPC